MALLAGAQAHASDNSLSNATCPKSSLKCLMRYSGGWPSITGMSPVTVYVPRAVLCMRRRTVVDGVADLELVGHYRCLDWSATPLTPKAVRLFHFSWVVQRVRSPLMRIMKEDGKLRSYGLALRRHRLLEEVILHLLGQIAPYPKNGLA